MLCSSKKSSKQSSRYLTFSYLMKWHFKVSKYFLRPLYQTTCINVFRKITPTGKTPYSAQSPVNKVSNDRAFSGGVRRFPGHNYIISICIMDLNVHWGSGSLRNWRWTICQDKTWWLLHTTDSLRESLRNRCMRYMRWIMLIQTFKGQQKNHIRFSTSFGEVHNSLPSTKT